MSRLLLKLALVITLGFVLVNLAACIVGSTQPSNAIMSGFTEGCQGQLQPCWYGLVPEQTLFDIALQLLTDRKFSVVKSPEGWQYVDAVINADDFACDVWLFRSVNDRNRLGLLSFQNCRMLKMGDILNQFGTPYTVGTTLSCAFKPWEHLVPMSNYWIHYPKIGSLSLNAHPDYWTWLSPNDFVISFDVSRLAGDYPPPPKWEGFIPFWRYFSIHVDQVQTSSCGP